MVGQICITSPKWRVAETMMGSRVAPNLHQTKQWRQLKGHLNIRIDEGFIQN